jgi:anaerobic selenocysteine-containing dehydrogenase
MIKLEEELKKGISRRAFNAGALAAAATLAGCGGGGESDTIVIGNTGGGGEAEPELEVKRFYGVSGHNCGGRCVSVAEVNNGRIVRIINDEGEYSCDGQYLDPSSRNIPNTRSCTKCRAYKYRVYHPGRLRYPLKQTKKRGDLTGFVRISWDQALTEIALKHKKVIDGYGVDAIYQIYAAGASAGSFNTASASFNSYALPLIGGGRTSYWASYSTHQWWFAQNGLTGADAIRGNHSNNLANYANSVVMWGDNSLSTSNPSSYSTIKAVEDMKLRVKGKSGTNPDYDGKVVYVGPEFSDTGVVCADEWIPSKPYTDAALVAGMIYHMLENTFNLDTGALRTDQTPWLDVDYLDTMVYGFFDSPAYNLDESTGNISSPVPTPTPGTDRNIPAVTAGQSYCSWLLGNRTGPLYSAAGISANYTAAQFAAIDSSAGRWSPCSFNVKGAPVTDAAAEASCYKTKQDYRKPKNLAWASEITGIPVEKIKYLAELFCKHGPIFVRWSGGFQKQAEGVTNFFATQTLQVVTKNVGDEGSIFTWGPFSGATTSGKQTGLLGSFSTLSTANLPAKPVASCTAWHAVLKNTYHDKFASTYTARHIPNYGALAQDNAYWDDGGVKGFIRWKRNPTTGAVLTYKDDTGKEYYDWEGRTGLDSSPNAHDGSPVYSGIRLMYNGGGNIFMNQHENTNDSREMLEALPLNNGDADTFCLVSVDNFLSPTPRWSDYVLPGKTYWEQPEVMGPDNSSQFYMSPATAAPGEARELFDIGRQIVRKYMEIGGQTLLGTSFVNANAVPYIGSTAVACRSIEDIVRTAFEASKSGNMYVKDKSWEEYKANPILRAKADDWGTLTPYRKAIMTSYRNFNVGDLLTQPFIKVAEAGNGGTEPPSTTSPFLSNNNTRHVITYEIDTFTRSGGAGGAYGAHYIDTSGAPSASLRMQVSNPVMVWNYKHRFEKWHGYLKRSGGSGKVGQTKPDLEGDEIVLPIPVYYAWQDYFVEAYGNGSAPADITSYPFMLTTTHNRYRAHSSMSENPLLRELSHCVPGQDSRKLTLKGNDYGYYASASDTTPNIGESSSIPPLNRLIKDNVSRAEIVDAANKGIVTFAPVLINDSDAEELGINNGDLVELRNPIGIVYCVAKRTKRCARKFVSLHQGCWYDPRTIDGEVVDVGGCCNTLMASQPSRIDNGNAEQSALVSITKISY